MSTLNRDTFKQEIQKHFAVGDEVVCATLNRIFRVTTVNDDQVHLTPIAGGEVISLDFAALSAALAHAKTEQPISTALACFAQEFENRAEQAQRDQDVDDMWKSAIVCQL